jgi:hypothetical protein
MSFTHSAHRLGILLAAGLLMFAWMPEAAHAQLRRFSGPPVRGPARPVIQSPFSFSNFARPFPITLPSQTRVTRGAFNPQTGAFMPTPGGNFVLAGRVPFQPVSGSFVPTPGGPFRIATQQFSPLGNIVTTRGTFVPSDGSFARFSQGSFNPNDLSFVPSGGGASFLRSRGVFVPSNGNFVPSPLGNFVLTTRQAFNPQTNTFVPSADGGFVSNVRGAFVPNNANRVFFPTPIGLNLGNGAFIPNSSFALANGFFPTSTITSPAGSALWNGYFPSTGIVGPTNPYILQARNSAANFTAYSQAINRAYSNSIYTFRSPYLPVFPQPIIPPVPLPTPIAALSPPYNPNTPSNPAFASTAASALANGYFPSTTTGNVGPTNPYILQARNDAANFTAYGQAVNNAYLNSIYRANRGFFVHPLPPPVPLPQPYYPSNYNYNTNPNYNTPTTSSYSPAPANAPRAPAAVAAFAIPSNDDGSIAWPFAFRLLAPDAKRALIEPLESQLQLLSSQATVGRVNPAIAREAREGVDRLYRWLREHRLDLAEGSVSDANRFLGRVDGALRAIAPDA